MSIKIEKEINGIQLKNEFISAGLQVDYFFPTISNGTLQFDGNNSELTLANRLVQNHIPTYTEQAEKEAARKAIFEKLGLTEEEAKLLLS